jgi:uncharacterized membrane protein YgdD (TMEM256/DUF423 family)
MTSRAILTAAAVLGALAVVLGAFGAHALREALDERSLAVWQTAVDYQFRHVLALLAAGLLARMSASRATTFAAVAFLTGIVLFSGSLYALALGAPRLLGAITPLGGVAFIAGWLALAWSAFRHTDT